MRGRAMSTGRILAWGEEQVTGMQRAGSQSGEAMVGNDVGWPLGHLWRKQVAGFFRSDLSQLDQPSQNGWQTAVVSLGDLIEVRALAQLFTDLSIFLARPGIAGVAGT